MLLTSEPSRVVSLLFHQFSKMRFIFLTLMLASAQSVFAQGVPAPSDQPYPGTIKIAVDATNLDQKIFQVREQIPVTPGKLTLLYPQWIPGHHAPSSMATQLAGLTISANGKPLAWKRDTLDMFAFHLEVPEGVRQLDVEYQYLSPLESNQGRIAVTQEITNVQWVYLVLYPAGYTAHNIPFQASLKLPVGWQFGTALETTGQTGAQFQFKETTLENLIDSPVLAGKYFKRVDLDSGAKVPVFLNMVGDRADALNAKPEQIEAHRKLVQQAYRLFGSRHYAHYDFLLAISDEFGGIGLEHHQSSENGVKLNYFTEWDKTWADRDLLPHEYTHSWNGKFRRPADLSTPNYNVPMQNSLLWLYEGQTQYWGEVLAARSGLKSLEQARDTLAVVAATYDVRTGRLWRSLQDTTNMPIMSNGLLTWPVWQRPEDYYAEGQLIWLDVDTKIREMSGDQKSLNDFAHAFFSMQDGRQQVLTYTFEDIVHTLNAIQPYDWARFLRMRLDDRTKESPKDGLTRGGWKLVYTDTPNDTFKMLEEDSQLNDFSYSLGLSISKKGRLENLIWNGPAFKQGLSGGMTVLAVNGRAYKPELLKEAIAAAKNSSQPVDLLVKKDDRYRTVSFDYHEGLKYPNLVRIEGTKDRLTDILQPMK